MARAACSRGRQLFAQVAVTAVSALPPSAGLTAVLLSHSISSRGYFGLLEHCPAPRNSLPPGAPGRGCSPALGQRLQRQAGALVRDALDLPCRVTEQLVSKVGQGPRGRDLLPDLRDLLVIGVTAGQAVANHANAILGQPRPGPCLPVILVGGDFDRPPFHFVLVPSPPSASAVQLFSPLGVAQAPPKNE